ncbi:MAG: hypothetical protein U9R14_02350 [Patescibacteria group bacterium]|nr:hypothetical protein [Patescibacteria group bacterium]
MTKKIQCQSIFSKETRRIKVRVIRAPLVDSLQLRSVIYQRARAVVL